MSRAERRRGSVPQPKEEEKQKANEVKSSQKKTKDKRRAPTKQDRTFRASVNSQRQRHAVKRG